MTAEVIAEPDAAPHRVRLDVGGMSCAACAARVETKLNRQPGVHASVNFATGVATIDAPGSLDEGNNYYFATKDRADTGPDPFEDAGKLDFRLKPGSPARDAGAALSAPFDRDPAGVQRPQGAGWDIGVHEMPATP